MLKPTDDYLVLVPDTEETAGGLVIDGINHCGLIVNIPGGESFFKLNQKVIFKPQTAIDIYYRLQKYMLVKREDVMAVIADD